MNLLHNCTCSPHRLSPAWNPYVTVYTNRFVFSTTTFPFVVLSLFPVTLVVFLSCPRDSTIPWHHPRMDSIHFIFHPSSSTPPKTPSHIPDYLIKLLLTPLLSYVCVPVSVKFWSYNLLVISSLSVVSTFFIHLQWRYRIYSSTWPRVPDTVRRCLRFSHNFMRTNVCTP